MGFLGKPLKICFVANLSSFLVNFKALKSVAYCPSYQVFNYLITWVKYPWETRVVFLWNNDAKWSRPRFNLQLVFLQEQGLLRFPEKAQN